MELDIDRRERVGRVILSPRGVIDLATIDIFRAALDEAFLGGGIDLVLDLNGVSFIDSSGLGALISARRRAHVFRGSLLLACHSPAVMRVLELTALDRVFTIVPTFDDADALDTYAAPAR